MAMTIDTEAFRKSFQTWLLDARSHGAPAEDADYDKLVAWQAELHRGGWLGLDWPDEYGGHGLSPVHQLIVYQELIAADVALPVNTVGLDVAGPTLMKFGTYQQKKQHISEILRAREIWCQGFSEPNAGSDLASLRTSGVVDGDELVINGQKIWTSHASHAHWCLLLVRTGPSKPKHRGITMVMMPLTTQGITIRPIRQINGESEFSEVFYDEVRVPVSNVLGPMGEGWRVAATTLASERGRHAIMRHARLERHFEELLQALRQEPVGADSLTPAQLVRLGRLCSMMIALKSTVSLAAVRMSRNEEPVGWESSDKILLTETEQELYSTALDLLGPLRLANVGSTHELAASLWSRRYLTSRAYSIAGGTHQIQHNLVGEKLLGLPRK
jgi:alkylation response protein AidB-like acyl-CoA dehydrogenase